MASVRSEGLTTFPAAADGDAPLQIVVDPKVDEELFLIRALEALYGRLIPNLDDPAGLPEDIKRVRQEAVRHAEYIKAHRLDDAVAGLYGDLVSVIDAYDTTISDIIRILDEADARAGQNRSEVLSSSITHGVEGGVASFLSGMPISMALTMGAGKAIFNYLIKNIQDLEQLNAGEKADLRRILANYEKKFDETLARAQSISPALAKKKGWDVGEVGFDMPAGQDQQILELFVREDYRELARLYELAMRKRPRDPFARMGRAAIIAMALGDTAKPGDLMRQSDECFEAAALVPEGRFYDDHRAGCVALAAALASEAARVELGRGQWAAAATTPAPSGPRAVRLWRTYLALDEADASGEGRMELAYALARVGRHADALSVATQVSRLQEDNPDYAYNLACLYSLNNRADEALRSLEHAIKDCVYIDIATARTDPDLAVLRYEKQFSFNNLTSVKYEWTIDWGLLSDDICLTNKSPFPLTNVSFAARVTSAGYDPWAETFTVDVIFPGETQRWNTRISSRGNNSRGSANLTADQNR